MQQAEPTNQISFSLGRLIMMGILSILLFISMFMSVLTPYPVALISLLYGKSKGIAVAIVASLLLYLITAQQGNENFALVSLFVVAMAIGISLAEIIHRRLPPVRGIMFIGIGAISLSLVGVYAFQESQGKTIREVILTRVVSLKPFFDKQIAELKKTDNQNTLEIEAYFKQPEVMTDDILKQGPSLFVISLFVTLWANMFLLLKSNRLFKNLDLDYSEKILVKFKVPEHLVVGVIIGLALTIWGDSLGPIYSALGWSILKILGVFYFFQGFGIYIEFLDFVRLTGFLRSILIVLTVLTANEVLAIVGLFDMFVNFRKFLKKKEQI